MIIQPVYYRGSRSKGKR